MQHEPAATAAANTVRPLRETRRAGIQREAVIARLELSALQILGAGNWQGAEVQKNSRGEP
ncbi:hypothetical protein [Microbulbifer sp. TRSA005]|uniref:hypothetical protein n=1 Tax=Microbulbifer sp. TRSA005 TaxID=3243383 RepID=UPI00403A5505